MGQIFISSSAILGLLGVALGAFGSHGLKERLSTDMMSIYQTGSDYHLIHAVALLGIGILARQMDSKAIKVAGIAMIFGILVFSGSLYALAISEVRILGAITPIGGIGLMVGWAALALAAMKNP
jgi:uncharacterized membrane protein YgdD (TMEM256/DUF423 family)